MSGYRYIHTFRTVLDHLEDAARYGAVFVSELYSNRLVPVYPGQENDYAQDTSILILKVVGFKRMDAEIEQSSDFKRKKLYLFFLKYLASACVIIILLSSIANVLGWISM